MASNLCTFTVTIDAIFVIDICMLKSQTNKHIYSTVADILVSYLSCGEFMATVTCWYVSINAY